MHDDREFPEDDPFAPIFLSAQEEEWYAKQQATQTSSKGLWLPEAPASVNVRVLIAGREVQITLRDVDEDRLLARLMRVLDRFLVRSR